MANTFAPFGFRSFGHRDGSAPTMGLERRFMFSSDTTAVFTGDCVYSSTASGFGGYITAGSTSGSQAVGGVFAGCEFYSPSAARVLWSSYFPASVSSSSPVTAYIISDPEMQFIAQASTVAVMGSSNIGMCIGFTSTSPANGNTLTGQSAVCLVSTGAGANSSFPFTIVDVYSNFAPPGVNGTSTTEGGQIMVVAFNNLQQRRAGQAGVLSS